MEKRNKVSKKDLNWILAFIGTSIGAGVLFLPLQASSSGFLVLFISLLIVIPITYYSHKAYGKFLLSSSVPKDFTGVAKEHFGDSVGIALNILYFLTFFVLIVIYSTALTNDLGDYLKNIHLVEFNLANTSYFSFIILFVLFAVAWCGEKAILRLMGTLTSLLIILLFIISIYLIPNWNLHILSEVPTGKGFLGGIFQNLPILMFSFMFFPAMSAMVISYRENSDKTVKREKKINRVIWWTVVLLVFAVIFFVVSCMFSVTKEQLNYAFKANASILIALSHGKRIAFFSEAAPIIGIAAIITSFLGVLFALKASAHELVNRMLDKKNQGENCAVNTKRNETIILIFLCVAIWLLVIANFSILGVLGAVLVPFLAIFLYIIPVFSFFKISRLKVNKSFVNICVLSIGILMFFSYALGELIKAMHS